MAAFEDFCRITLLFLVVISASDAFRLRARFPRPQGKDFGLHAKRHLCPFCIYETKTFSQKVKDLQLHNCFTIKTGLKIQLWEQKLHNWPRNIPAKYCRSSAFMKFIIHHFVWFFNRRSIWFSFFFIICNINLIYRELFVNSRVNFLINT